jgi:hypothetical protein
MEQVLAVPAVMSPVAPVATHSVTMPSMQATTNTPSARELSAATSSNPSFHHRDVLVEKEWKTRVSAEITKYIDSFVPKTRSLVDLKLLDDSIKARRNALELALEECSMNECPWDKCMQNGRPKSEQRCVACVRWIAKSLPPRCYGYCFICLKMLRISAHADWAFKSCDTNCWDAIGRPHYTDTEAHLLREYEYAANPRPISRMLKEQRAHRDQAEYESMKTALLWQKEEEAKQEAKRKAYAQAEELRVDSYVKRIRCLTERGEGIDQELRGILLELQGKPGK